MRQKIITVLCVLISAYFLVPSSYASTGTYAMSFSELISNPFTASLANTVTAANNANAIYINPASLISHNNRHISAQIFKYVENIEYKQFQMIQPYLDGNISLSYTWLSYGDYNQTTWVDKDGGESGIISNKGSLLNISYARLLLNTNFGISAKYYEEVLASYKSKALSIDLGLQKKIKDNLDLGLSISNLAIQNVSFLNDASYLRKAARLGVQYRPKLLKNKFVLLTDYVYLRDKSSFSYAGIIHLHKKLSIRLGSNKLSDLFNLSMGVGIKLGTLDMDFSYKNVADFSDVYRIQVGVKF
tara:strand:+ start:2062 stop:2964 length:903 start_codon:yes stop_codon:yes gene_type:complete